MQFTPLILAALGLAACSPAVPDSGQGVGFGDYGAYLRQQTAAPSAQPLNAQPLNAQPYNASQPQSGFSTSAAAAAIANAQGGQSNGAALPFQYENDGHDRAGQVGGGQVGGGQINTAPLTAIQQTPQITDMSQQAPADGLRGVTPAGIQEMTINYATDTAGVSNEQDFDAVSASRTIEGDKAQIERNRAQYKIDQPTGVPQRPANVGPSIVEYALATQHPVGVKLFSRSPFRFKNPQKACAQYDTEDSAQEAFLAAGGPNRDRLGLDPDGDGFACGWDPSPFRAVAQ